MGTYTIKDNVTGEIIDIINAPNLGGARAEAARKRFDTRLATADEILNWGKDGKGFGAAQKREQKAKPVDPNQTDLVAQISEGDKPTVPEAEVAQG